MTKLGKLRFVATLLLVSALQFGSGFAALGEERTAVDPRREWGALANGRTEFDIADPALVPSQLAEAATQSGCHWQDIIKDVPLHVFRIKTLRFAMIACPGTPAGGGHQMYDVSIPAKPRILEFPAVGYPDGFTTSVRPGAMTWKPDSGLLEAVPGTDFCQGPSGRYTYRWNGRGVAIIRVELSLEDCSPQGPWRTIWEAPNWSDLARSKDH
jgi:hypothetical protein